MLKMLHPILALALVLTCSVAPSARSRAKATKPSVKARNVQLVSSSLQQAEQFIRTELFFGSGKPDGTDITEDEWQQFLTTEITPRFPARLTALTGLGQYRGANGIIVRERSLVLSLIYPRSMRRRSDKKIEQIRSAYKTAFQQESVLRVDSVLPIRVSF